MTDHVRDGDLAEILAAPESDPRRRHAADCARCGARLAAYSAFMAAPRERPGTDLADARTRLGEVMQREIRGEARSRPGPSEAAPGFMDRLRSWFAVRPGPAWGAVAAVVVVGLVLAGVQVARRDAGQDALRGGGQESIRLLDVRVVGDSLELRWSRMAGADAYEVSLLSTELAPIATRRTGGADTLVRFGPGDWAPGIASGDLLYGRVAAFRQDAAIATSPPLSLRVP